MRSGEVPHPLGWGTETSIRQPPIPWKSWAPWRERDLVRLLPLSVAGYDLAMGRLTPADTILAIDIGNSRVGFGIWDQDALHDVHRVGALDDEAISDALEAAWKAAAYSRHRAVVIGSVNEAVARRVAMAVEDICDMPAVVVRDEVPLPMPMGVEYPDEVGVDRVCSAAAAFDRLHQACAVASFGTAITIDCVSAEGMFLGGAILPGLQLSCDALREGTAQLPRVETQTPEGPFGRNTEQAIVNGVAYGAVGALREIVERYATELGTWPQLVVTGGNAGLVAELSDFVDNVVPDLCLIGIALAYRQAAGEPS